MTARARRVAMALALLAAAWAVAAQTPQDLLQQLRSDNSDERLTAARALAPHGAEAMGALSEMLGGEDRRLDVTARVAVESIAAYAAGPEGASQREAVAKALGDLAMSGKPQQTRVFAVRQLALCGGDESLPVLWDLLMFQPEMHEIARWVLVRMPGREPVETLKRAATEVGDPEQRVGLLNALAARASVDMYPAAVEALGDPHEGVRIAALDLLAHIPDAAGADLMRSALAKGSPAEKAAAQEAFIDLGYTLLDDGRPSAAQGLFMELSRAAEPRARAAGIAGLGRAGGPGALARLMAATYDADPVVRGAVAEALVALPGSEATEAIAGALSHTGPDQAPPLGVFIRVLGQRRDPVAVPALVALLSHQGTDVRVEALRALGEIGGGDADTVAAIVESLAEAPEVLDAAEFALARLTGDGVTSALAQHAGDEQPAARRVCTAALGYHTSAKPFPVEVVLKALHDEDEGVRLAAIRTLSRLRDPATVAALLPLLAQEGPTAAAAQGALSLFRDPAATERMVVATGAADTAPAVRAGLVNALAAREDQALAGLFAAAAQADDEAVAVAALEALGRLRDSASAPAFIARLADGRPAVKRAAVRGYLAIAEAREKEDGAAALVIYQEALGMDIGVEEQATALRGIGRLADVSAVGIVEPYLDDPRLKGAAAEAILPMAQKLRAAGEKDRAIALCRKAVEATKDRNVLREAARCLREMGIDLQLAAQRGCVTSWWVLGPFPGRERATKGDFVPVAERIDLTKTVRDGERVLEWKPAPVDDPQGLLDFEQTVARMDNCGAYAYAEVESDADREVLLKIGSDDSVFCWLNGEQVHAWDGNRGWGEDQDTVKARVKAGTNTILCKVINGGAQWSLSLRFTDPDGKPLVLQQRMQ